MSDLPRCADCLPYDASAALAWRSERVEVLVEDSHFRVTISQCVLCTAMYLRVFAEKIDWAGGNDPQQVIRFPISFTQACALFSADELEVESLAQQFGSAIRFAESYWPATGDPSTRWAEGSCLIMPHD
jgi:hypothetical protein